MSGTANVLSSFELDRSADRRVDEGWITSSKHAPEARFLVMSDLRHLVTEGNRPAAVLLKLGMVRDLGLDSGEALFLGRADERTYFAVRLERRQAEALGERLTDRCSWQDLRQVGSRLSPRDAQLLAYSRGVAYWHQRHQFCGDCGRPTREERAGHVRRCTGAACGREHFPRTDPAVIVLIRSGEEVLLGRQASWPPGMYSALAGFVEPGESLEAAARREIFEEVGVRLGRLVYSSSQPWPFPASLMVGFFADTEDQRLHIDRDEIEDALWIDRATLAAKLEAKEISVPPRLSIARRLIDEWLLQEEE